MDAIWAEIERVWERLNRHHVVLLEGNGPLDPPLTQRATAVEVRVTALEKSQADAAAATKSRQTEIRGYLVALILLVLGDFLSKHLGH